MNFYFMKTASFWILVIKIPDRLLFVKNKLDTKMFRVPLFSFFTLKTPRVLAAFAPFGILIS